MTDHEAIVAAFEEIEILPVVLFDQVEFTVAEIAAGDAAATKLIDALVAQLGAGG